MRSIKYLLFSLSLLCIQQIRAIDYLGIKDTNDTLCVHYKDSLKFDNISIIWDTYTIEDVVESDGTPGSQIISVSIIIKNSEKDAIWRLNLPANYKEFIKNKPKEVSYYFEGYTFCISGADFENNNNSFLQLQVTKTETTDAIYFIDNKQVSENEFRTFLNDFREVSGTWFCAETKNGGMVGYDMKDEKGNCYRYRTEIENKVTKTTLNNKKSLFGE